MAATVQATHYNGAGPTANNVDNGSGGTAPVFGLDDSIQSTAKITIPNATGTNYSWYKALALLVTAGGGSTSISNRKVKWASTPTTGLYGFFKAVGTDAGGAYAQASGANKPADSA